jgi:CRP-like cAMP-binding protein
MTIENDIALLHGVPTFALLGREPLRILAIGAENRIVPDGEVLFREGDVADAGYVVEEGSFLLASERTGNAVRATVVGPGTLLGELALITETRRPLTATAQEPSSVIRIPRALFLKMLDGYPDLAYRLREAMAARAIEMVGELASVRRSLQHEGE